MDYKMRLIPPKDMMQNPLNADAFEELRLRQRNFQKKHENDPNLGDRITAHSVTEGAGQLAYGTHEDSIAVVPKYKNVPLC